jgi:hypothetical protein
LRRNLEAAKGRREQIKVAEAKREKEEAKIADANRQKSQRLAVAASDSGVGLPGAPNPYGAKKPQANDPQTDGRAFFNRPKRTSKISPGPPPPPHAPASIAEDV